MHISRFNNRGSALLIVLGLLSFLMISAVAFSISMRTERSAAAAYRRSLTSRELLASAFADARATTEFAIRSQQDASTPVRADDPTTQTPEAIVPFRYPGQNVYGRLISSRSTGNLDATSHHSAGDEPPAFLLDDKAMRHIPPYIANSVYRSLELREDLFSSQSASRSGYDEEYYIDWVAGWKPVTVDVPKQKITVGGEEQTEQNLSKAVVGRMAWAVINVSDSLDINAIGSASPVRGIGLTGSDLAYGFDGRSSKNNYEPEAYDLFDVESDSDPAASTLELPVFCSNGDFYWFASRAKKSTSYLQPDNGNEEPYAWEAAIEREGDGYFAPFSVYGFWPNIKRISEKKITKPTPDEETIRCDEITAESLRSYDAGNGKRLSALYKRIIGGEDSAAQTFVRFMHDYLDKDSIPSPQSGDDARGYSEFAWPTVENVPMICEVAYDASDNTFAKNTRDKLQNKLTKKVEASVENENELEKTLKDDLDIELELPAMQIGVRTYFPGAGLSDESYKIQADAFAMAFGKAIVGDSTNVDFSKSPDKPHKYSASGSGTVKGGAEDDIFATASDVAKLSGGKLSFSLRGKDIPVALPSETEIRTVKLHFLIDTLFRVRLARGSDNADIVPVASNVEREFRPEDYPKTFTARTTERTMIEQDAQFFRVSKALTYTFALKWKQDGEPRTNQDGKTTYSYKLELVKGTQGGTAGEVSVTDPANDNNEVVMTKGGNGTFSKEKSKAPTNLTRLMPETGAWFAIDPRYNWISPMLGSIRSFPGVSFDNPELSSPHWVFYPKTSLTSGSTELSDPMKEYESSQEERIPFRWGLKIQDVRYGYNDSDQMLLPAEIGFIPVPLPSGKLSPSVNGYNRLQNDKYFTDVADFSYFRTLPITDFRDRSEWTSDYKKYAKLASEIGGFSGKDFPEEHRGLVHAFAAQDDYNLSQKLHRQAMLGIPNTVREAAYNTFQRLTTGKEAKRIPDEIVTDMQKTLGNIEAPKNTEASKYDEFVCDYLFPTSQSNNPTQARDWNKSQRIYKGGPSSVPERPKQPDFLMQTSDNDRASFAARLMSYNDNKDSNKLGQNDATLLVGCARECFGIRQQLFLYILRADAIAYNSARHLSEHVALSTARAVALVWRDPFGLLPDRVIYYQVL